MKKIARFSFFAVFIAALVSSTLYLCHAQSGKNAATQPAPGAPGKTTAQAVQDLRRDPPLDPTKLGDPLPRNLFVELSKLINPSVVSISTSQNIRQSRGGGYRDPMQDFFEEFFGGRSPYGGRRPQQNNVQALGTGFIIRADGLIVTNNHVVEQADVIKVQLDNNSSTFYEAEVVGRDARTDIALIKIDAKKQLPVAPLGVSATVQVGEWVAAFGNPYGHAHSMTKGIVSAVGREIGEINRFPFIQTDASINPGNSGGPLVNTQGYVIGVNTAIDARAQGIGFAIPIDNVKSIIQQLEETGHVKRGYIGVGLAPISPEVADSLGLENAEGVAIVQLEKGGPAAKGGAEVWDIITEFNGKKISNATELSNAVGDTEVGKKAKMKVIRIINERPVEKTVDVTVAEFPREPAKKREAKRYVGQKAPFELGFKVSDLTPAIANDLGLRADLGPVPVVIEVDRGTPASRSGLHVGDVILDINRVPVRRATDVVRSLRKGTNILRVDRGDGIAIVTIEAR